MKPEQNNQFNPNKRGVSNSRQKQYFTQQKQSQNLHIINHKLSQKENYKIHHLIQNIDQFKKQHKLQEHLNQLLADLLQNQLQRIIRKNLKQKPQEFFQSKQNQLKLNNIRFLGQIYLSLLNFDEFYPQHEKTFQQENIEQRRIQLQEIINEIQNLFKQNDIKAEYTELKKYVISGQFLVSMLTYEQKLKTLEEKIHKYAVKRGQQFVEFSKIIHPLLMQVFDDLLSIYSASNQEKFNSMIHVGSEQIIKKVIGKDVQKEVIDLASSLINKGLKSLFKF